jgi:hypothetical protein
LHPIRYIFVELEVRILTTPFDIVLEGSTRDLSPAQAQEKLEALAGAGATW